MHLIQALVAVASLVLVPTSIAAPSASTAPAVQVLKTEHFLRGLMGNPDGFAVFDSNVTVTYAVRNDAFVKSVGVRYTNDSWMTFHEAPASYVSDLPQPGLELWSTNLLRGVHTTNDDDSIAYEFAAFVAYNNGPRIWDQGNNYKLANVYWECTPPHHGPCDASASSITPRPTSRLALVKVFSWPGATLFLRLYATVVYVASQIAALVSVSALFLWAFCILANRGAVSFGDELKPYKENTLMAGYTFHWMMLTSKQISAHKDCLLEADALTKLVEGGRAAGVEGERVSFERVQAGNAFISGGHLGVFGFASMLVTTVERLCVAYLVRRQRRMIVAATTDIQDLSTRLSVAAETEQKLPPLPRLPTSLTRDDEHPAPPQQPGSVDVDDPEVVALDVEDDEGVRSRSRKYASSAVESQYRRTATEGEIATKTTTLQSRLISVVKLALPYDSSDYARGRPGEGGGDQAPATPRLTRLKTVASTDTGVRSNKQKSILEGNDTLDHSQTYLPPASDVFGAAPPAAKLPRRSISRMGLRSGPTPSSADPPSEEPTPAEPLDRSQPPNPESSIHIDDLDDEASTSTAAPFEPLRPEVMMPYLRLGLIVADWAARIACAISFLLFFTLPPWRSWTTCFGTLTFEDWVIKSISTLAMATVFECFNCAVEVKVAGYDYAAALEELKVCGIRGNAVAYIVFAMSAVVGIVMGADTGVVVNNDCYIQTGRAW
ncbi:hypothetical protein HK101_011627 [Irineochytrium annulatum]|nr:hypothetical protein HK101_011627 [Irineochytrium annulatum]